MKLKLGDTIYLEGHEFVVASYQITQNREGRSVAIVAMDPIIVASQRHQLEERQQVIEKTLAHLKTHEGDDA
jgi:hypothetical protein